MSDDPGHPYGSETPSSLFDRLEEDPSDPVAQRELVERYGPRIYAWCRRWGLQEADARDVTQDVLLKLARRMGRFRYDRSRSFRAYLKTLTHYAWRDAVKLRAIPEVSGEDSARAAALDTAEARDDLTRRLEELHEQQLLALAMNRVSRRVEPHTWEAFRLTALEGLSGAAASERTGMKEGAVFVAKCRVQKMLQDEIRRLDPP